jgi:hypothetical protein
MRNESLLAFSALFDNAVEGDIGMAVTSYCDLWREKTLEGKPNEPAGLASVRMLVERFHAIATASGAKMTDGELRLRELGY